MDAYLMGLVDLYTFCKCGLAASTDEESPDDEDMNDGGNENDH
ncbi:MAG: hypothetical protein ACYC3G_00635 [Minisyncoccota bacterium]